jgi:hypothetical protein
MNLKNTYFSQLIGIIINKLGVTFHSRLVFAVHSTKFGIYAKLKLIN